MAGIVAFGAYVPRLRLERQAIAAAHKWMNPSAGAGAKGTRAIANWDEDAITMAVEACRDALSGHKRAEIDALFLASTTLPFADRQGSGILAAALTLPEVLAGADITSSQRAGTTALAQALGVVAGGGARQALVAASDHRQVKAASTQEMQVGDGAAALVLSAEDGLARYLGGISVTVDFVDHFRGEGEDFDYGWEERWIRDEGYAKIVPKAIKAALAKTGIAAGEIAHFVMPCVFSGLAATLAKTCGLAAESVRDNLMSVMGEAGAAHSLIMLVSALETAKPGEKIMVIGFGQGCDVLMFETTAALATYRPAQGLAGALKAGRPETNYMKYLIFRNLVIWERGMRAEKDNKTALTTLYRKRDMILGLVGGQCRTCGTAQFPRARICVNPNCQGVDTQDPYDFADRPATILSWSADYLTYSMDPPQHYGMVTFAEGGRFMADFTDVETGTIDSGQTMRMMFRIKDFDDKRGFRKYFWKAAPIPASTPNAA